MAGTKTALRLLGIAALAVLFLAGTRDEPSDSPFQQAVRRLRVGMSASQVRALARLSRPGVGVTASSDYGSQWVIYSDHQRHESLSLMFVDDDFHTSRLIKWEIWHR
ncbi:MAG TPA: hypothetical protein VEI07_16570 [Planctomycetaceae bacterium]|nr:hypothetical protein [Planctomycetaceae bacterium]